MKFFLVNIIFDLYFLLVIKATVFLRFTNMLQNQKRLNFVIDNCIT